MTYSDMKWTPSLCSWIHVELIDFFSWGVVLAPFFFVASMRYLSIQSKTCSFILMSLSERWIMFCIPLRASSYGSARSGNISSRARYSLVCVFDSIGHQLEFSMTKTDCSSAALHLSHVLPRILYFFLQDSSSASYNMQPLPVVGIRKPKRSTTKSKLAGSVLYQRACIWRWLTLMILH